MLGCFEELNSSRDYAARYRTILERRNIPVVLPKASARRRHWKSVLAAYDELSSTQPHEPKAAPAGACIVAVGKAFLPVARMLSLATGCRLVVEENNTSNLEKLNNECTAATFVGAPHLIDSHHAREIASKISVPWSVVTGVDFEGATFAAAKLLALRQAPNSAHKVVLLDVIGKTFVEIDGQGRTNLFADLGEMEIERDLSGTLIMHVHGEGAHADLSTTVVCGRTGVAEKNRVGRSIAGGCHGGRVSTCKRKGRHHDRILEFRKLRSLRVALLSCNGYTPNDETFPSDLSAPLACLEGYACEILTSLRALSYPKELPLAFARYAAIDQGLDRAARLAADAACWEGMRDAYVRLGVLSHPASRDIDHRPIPAGIRVHSIGTKQSASILAIDSEAVRGRRHVVVFDRASRHAAVRDATVQILQSRSDLLVLMNRLDRSAWWQQRIETVVLASPAAQAVKALEAVRGASDALREALDTGQAAVAASAKSGLLERHLSIAIDLVGLSVRNWDARFVRLLELIGRDFGPGELLHRGSSRAEYNPGGSCERCGAPIEVRSVDAIDSERDCAIATTCPNCGQRDFYWRSEGECLVTSPPTAAPNSTIRIRVVRPGLGRRAVANGWVLVQFKEKAGGRALVQRCVRANRGVAEVWLRVPGRCAPDLHTLKITWVENLTLWFARRRIACLPR